MVKAPKPPELTAEETKLLQYLEEHGFCSEKDISEALDKSSAGIVELAQSLRNKGIPVWRDRNGFFLGSTSIEFSPEDVPIKESTLKIGIISDTVLGSKSEQPTALRQAFLIAEREGVNFMIHLGVSAGKPKPTNKEEFHKLTALEQIDHIVNSYPFSTKFKVRLMSGYHDMTWRKEGVNILAAVCEQRQDLIFRGDNQSDFELQRGAKDKWPILKAVYHGGDNSPYSKSYPIQGYKENLVQDVREMLEGKLPDIAVVAGQGVFCDLSGDVINHLFAVPGIRMVPPSVMSKKRRAVVPSVGFVILTIKFDDDGKFSLVSSCFPLESIKQDYKVKPSQDSKKIKKLQDNEQKVLKLLEETPRSRGELARAIDKSDKTIVATISNLRDAGFQIEGPDEVYKHYKLQSVPRTEIGGRDIKIDFDSYFYKTVTYGNVSDTHFGHTSELIEILNEAYDIFERRGIKYVNHTGDITNGPPKHEEHMKNEVHEYRATPLTNYVRDHYPKRKGIITRAITGDHDRWFLDKVGYDLLDPLSQIRTDILHLGVQQGEAEDDRVMTLLRHFNWGTGYAKSYKGQQVIEQGLLKEIEKDAAHYKGKVVVTLSGGGHVYCAMLYKGIIWIQLPCLQGKTGFITGLGKISDVGFVIHSITYNKKGALTRLDVEYFDRGSEALALVRKRTNAKKNGPSDDGPKNTEKKEVKEAPAKKEPTVTAKATQKKKGKK
jgi:biotin operon repressor/predicted phosphodiesterase